MTGGVRVLVYYRSADADAIRTAYSQASAALRGVPGLLGHELLSSAVDPGAYVVASSWTDLAAFTTWETGAEHRGATSPLRPFRDELATVPFGVYRIDSHRA